MEYSGGIPSGHVARAIGALICGWSIHRWAVVFREATLPAARQCQLTRLVVAAAQKHALERIEGQPLRPIPPELVDCLAKAARAKWN